jgi:hypothetical protein
MDNTELRSIPLPPYNDLYYADSDGFIWKKLKGRPRHKNEKVVTCYRFYNGEWYKLLKPQVHGKNNNYLVVKICPCDKTITVHRLVLLAFNYIPNYIDFQVNHKNRNSFDNTPNNLEWVTNQENCQHRVYTTLPAPYNALRREWERKFEERQKNSDFYQTQELGSWCSKYDEKEIIELLKTTDWTKRQIADYLGCSHRAVRYWQEKIKADRPKKLTLKEKINPLLEKNPDITPNQIADILQVRVTSIHAVLRKIKCND